MADKLSWTELRRTLAQRAGVSEKQAGAFLNALQAQLTEALKQDKMVKINGLGTFKLQAVAPRKSVNVKTGEQIIIEGYNKVGFVPEASVKELVEKAGEMGATAEALHLTEEKEDVDPIKKLGAQAEEIVDILGELGQSPKKEVEVVKEVKEVSEVSKVSEVSEVSEVSKVSEVSEVQEEPEVQKPKKRYHFVRDTLICVVILLMLLLVGYFFFRHQLSGWLEGLMQPKAQVEEVTGYGLQVTEEEATGYGLQVTGEEELPEWTYEKLLKTEEITEGSRLAWISKKYYGDKVYWPYLYMANKDRLTNPSEILVGTPIRVPKLTAADRDTTSAQFEQVRREAEAALRR